MKKVVIICGLISGLIVCSMMVLTMGVFCAKSDFTHGMIYGYSAMLLAFSLIFVGIKNFRDKYNNGVISFGKAFTIGTLIALISSTMYVITWLIENRYFIPDFGDKYVAHVVANAKATGASAAAVAKQTEEVVKMMDMCKNPFISALFTYAEILPVGIVVALIAALILKKKAK